MISGEQILQSGGLPKKHSENPVIFMLVPTMRACFGLEEIISLMNI